MKVVKRVIVGVLVVALAAGGIYTGLVHVKKNKVTEVPVTSVSNLLTDWYSETTLDGTITTNVSQNINMDKDMIIEKIYVSQGDDVKKGDNLISFDRTEYCKTETPETGTGSYKSTESSHKSSEWRAY